MPSNPKTTDIPDLPWTIEAELMSGQTFKSGENIIDLVIARYLMSGDPTPFSWWVSKGHRPSDSALKLLANLLSANHLDDKKFPYKFEAIARNPKHGPRPKGPEKKLRDILIALYMQKLLQEYGQGSYESALSDTADIKWLKCVNTVA